MRILRSSAWLMLLMTLSVSTALAAAIQGRAVGPQGTPASGMLVVATHVETQFGGVARTDVQGRFVIDDLPPGEYAVSTMSPGQRSEAVLARVAESATAPPVLLRVVRAAGLQPGAGVSKTPRNFATVEVFYGTDRQEIKPGVYGPRRGPSVLFGRSRVSIPRSHRMGELESASVWRLEFRPDPRRHVALLGSATEPDEPWLAALSQAVARSPTRAAFVFVHGFNVSFNDAARRTAQLAYDLGFDGAPMFYSWPSNGSATDYLGDGDNAIWSVPHLARFLRLVAERSGAETLHLVAHSMGNRVLAAALADLAGDAAFRAVTRFDQVALVAPDIDSEIFRRDIAPRMTPAARRVTLYASTHDRALELARRLRAGYPRAGDLRHGPLLVPGIDTVDVSAVDTSLLGHSYFGDSASVIADLFYLLREGLEPAKRARLRQVDVGAQRYWRFVP